MCVHLGLCNACGWVQGDQFQQGQGQDGGQSRTPVRVVGRRGESLCVCTWGYVMLVGGCRVIR